MMSETMTVAALVLLLAVGTIAQDPPSGPWNLYEDGNDNYIARHECSFVQAGDKFYLFGGRENATVIDVFDIPSNSWNPNGIGYLPEAPYEYNHFQAVEYEGLIWVVFGFEDNANPYETDAHQIAVFDPANEKWMEGPEPPVDRLRGGGGLVVHNGNFYSVAGNNNGHRGGYQPWLDFWNPRTNSFVTLPDAPRPRDHFHAAVCAGKLWVAGGRQSGHPDGGPFRQTIAEVDYYDFGTRVWSTLPPEQNLGQPRAGTATVCMDDRWLIVIGGEGNRRPLLTWNHTEALDVVRAPTDPSVTWQLIGLLNHGRHGTQAILNNGSIFLAGGSPKQGGGRIHLMERFGNTSPVGTAMTAGVLIRHNVRKDAGIVKNPGGANVQGVYITDVRFTGDWILGNFKSGRQFRLPTLARADNRPVVIPIIWVGEDTGTSGEMVITHSGGQILEVVLDPVTGIKTTINSGFDDSALVAGSTTTGELAGMATPYDFYRVGTSPSVTIDYTFDVPPSQYFTLQLHWQPLADCSPGDQRIMHVFVEDDRGRKRCYEKNLDVYQQGCSTRLTRIYGAYSSSSGRLNVKIMGHGYAPFISAIDYIQVNEI